MNYFHNSTFLLFPLIQSPKMDQYIVVKHDSSSIQIYFQKSLIINIPWDSPSQHPIWLGNCIHFFDNFASKGFQDIKICATHSGIYLKKSSQVQVTLVFQETAPESFQLLQSSSQNFYAISVNPNDKSFGSDLHKSKFRSIWNASMKWLKDIPKNSDFISNELWNINWLLQRTTHPIIDSFWQFLHSFIHSKSSQTRDSLKPKLNHSLFDKLSMIDDLMWFSPDFASKILLDIVSHFDMNSKMMKLYETQQNSYTCPPIWSFILLELMKFTGKSKAFKGLYKICKQNIEWWESHRFFKNYRLFGMQAQKTQLEIETNSFNSPRFQYSYGMDGKFSKIGEKHIQSLLLIDLNAQMCDYYQNMGVIALIFKDEEFSIECFKKAAQLQENARKYLWDPQIQYYCDFDMEKQQIRPIKTIAGLWSLFGGLATKKKASVICSHISNPDSFWTTPPLPIYSKDQMPIFQASNENFMAIQHILWIIIGLKRYYYNKVASLIACNTLKYLNDSFRIYGNLYQFYPLNSFNPNHFENRSSLETLKFGYSIFHPIHSLFYRGVAGIEILDNSVNFISSIEMEKDLIFSMYYRGKKKKILLSAKKNPIQYVNP